jgi:hypothetical protein
MTDWRVLIPTGAKRRAVPMWRSSGDGSGRTTGLSRHSNAIRGADCGRACAWPINGSSRSGASGSGVWLPHTSALSEPRRPR